MKCFKQALIILSFPQPTTQNKDHKWRALCRVKLSLVGIWFSNTLWAKKKKKIFKRHRFIPNNVHKRFLVLLIIKGQQMLNFFYGIFFSWFKFLLPKVFDISYKTNLFNKTQESNTWSSSHANNRLLQLQPVSLISHPILFILAIETFLSSWS